MDLDKLKCFLNFTFVSSSMFEACSSDALFALKLFDCDSLHLDSSFFSSFVSMQNIHVLH